MTPDILCIGAAHWDLIGRTTLPLGDGADVPGLITRSPGGVARNIAVALARAGMRPLLLSAVGDDEDGDELLDDLSRAGIDCGHVLCMPGRATDRYLAIEGPGGLVAAVADTGTLEAAGAAILSPLAAVPVAGSWAGPVVLDGNLLPAVLQAVMVHPALAASDLRLAGASAAKAVRLAPLIGARNVTFHGNRHEAAALCDRTFADAAQAAEGLIALGARRALVTDGAAAAADAALGAATVTAAPPGVRVTRVTGSGDVFMAAHIAAESRGADRRAALAAALGAAAHHVQGDTD